jgi:hypothetical protein
MSRRSWKEFKGVAARRIPDEIRASITPGGEITFDEGTFLKMGEPQAMLMFYEESSRTIGLKPASPDEHNAVLVRVRHARSNRVVRSMPFLRENGIELDRTLRFPFPFIEDEVLILPLKTAVTASRGGVHKVRRGRVGRPKSPRAKLNSQSHLQLVINDHGKENWIEEVEEHSGRPMKWYSLDSNGRIQKHIRDSLGVSISRDEE